MTFGENLRREREMRGVELREIADATKISIRFLQAIEQDRPDVLPGGIFPQAFVRQYARYLGLDVDKTVADFVYAHRGAVAERPTAPVVTHAPEPAPAGALAPRILAGVATVIVLAAVVSWWGRGREAPVEPAPLPSVPAAVVLPGDRVWPPPSVASPAPDASAGF